MADKDRIAELDKAIKDTRAELAAIQREKQTAANDPERLVLAEKRERRTSGTLDALERAKAAAEYTPPEPTDRAELLAGFQKYRDAKAGKVAKVAASIAAAERELAETDRALQQAAEDCDTEKTVELSEKRGELESKLKHLAEMRERVNALPVYPDGAITEEWAAICERTLPDWKKSVLLVETLAAEYKAACAGLLAMHETLKTVRADIGELAKAEGYTPPVFAPVFTAGLDSSRLVVSKPDYIGLAGIENPFSGWPL